MFMPPHCSRERPGCFMERPDYASCGKYFDGWMWPLDPLTGRAPCGLTMEEFVVRDWENRHPGCVPVRLDDGRPGCSFDPCAARHTRRRWQRELVAVLAFRRDFLQALHDGAEVRDMWDYILEAYFAED